MVRRPERVVLRIPHLALGSMRQGARPFINFEAHVEWHQRHEFLKCACPFLELLDVGADVKGQLRYPSIFTVTLLHMRLLSDMSSVRLTKILPGTLPSLKSAAIR